MEIVCPEKTDIHPEVNLFPIKPSENYLMKSVS